MKALSCIVVALGCAAVLVAAPLAAQSDWPEQGWEIRQTEMDYPGLLAALKEAIEAEGLFIVTEAGPTEAAASRGVSIPSNRVIGVFRNDYAVRVLRLTRILHRT